MLLELAIGDAYGAGFEYADVDVYRERNDLSGYVRHRRHKNVPGTYTDDTQMSLAVAEAIVEGRPWNKGELAEKFVEAFKRDPRKGYASSFYEFLCGVEDGTDFLERQDLPQVLVDCLEDGAYGRRYIEGLDVKLMGRVRELRGR